MPETTQIFGHFVGGKDVFEGEVLERRNPADTRESVALYHDGTPPVIDSAIAAADRAYPGWAELTRRDRGEVIFHAAEVLNTAEWRERVKQAMIAEIGKSSGGAASETEKTVRILRYMAGLAGHAVDKVFHPDQQGVHMYTKSEPVGVVAGITPFNFPKAVPWWKIAPALIAGNTVVLKPSPAAPVTSRLIVELFQEAVARMPEALRNRIDPGVLNLVHGGPELVRQLVQDLRVQAVTFTGSTVAGGSILRHTVNREPPLDPRHFVAEMGGQNALFVDEDADLDQAVAAGINGAFGGEGQRCTATSRFVVMATVYDEFMRLFMERSRALKIGPGRDPVNQVGPLVSEQALESALAAVAESIRNGMKLLLGGERLSEGDLAHGHFMAPTLLEGDPQNVQHLALKKEIFGPVAGICRVDSFEEAIRAVNGVSHKHAASMYTNHLGRANRFAARVTVGMVHVNNPTIGGDVQAPFGGLGGDTSFGEREMGPDAMRPFLADKTVDMNYGQAAAAPR